VEKKGAVPAYFVFSVNSPVKRFAIDWDKKLKLRIEELT